MEKKYVVGLGEALWDVLPEGKKLGGAPANFAFHAGQFGLNSIAVSALGEDKLAEETVQQLEEKGLQYCMPRVPYPTGTVQVKLDDEGIPTYDIKENVAWDNIPFTDEVKAKALGQDVLRSVKPGQMMTKIVRDELAALMGGTMTDIRLEGSPAVVLIAGLQGSGKTTFSGKLANLIKSKKGRQVLLVAGDVYRPAAIDQLKILGQQVGVEVYTEEGNRNPVQIAENAVRYARANHINTVIVDTAGRLAVDEAMMQEITAIKQAVKPGETLFVVDSMTGQDAVNTAREFNQRLDFDGVVLTKLDGDTRGGAAISIRAVVNKPLKFISSGEKMDAIQVFHPERMADRILGMGDVVSLVERAQEQYDEEEARRLKKKIVKNQFNFNDFMGQIAQIKKMGNLKDLASMIPGMGKALKNVEISDDVFKQTEAIINSMTPLEREKPEIIDAKRRERLAKGSGTTMAEVNKLMKQFEDTRKMMKTVAGGNLKMPKMPGGMMRR